MHSTDTCHPGEDHAVVSYCEWDGYEPDYSTARKGCQEPLGSRGALHVRKQQDRGDLKKHIAKVLNLPVHARRGQRYLS